MSFLPAEVALVSLSAAEWPALAAWLTAAIAVVAGLVAWRQLGEARRLRREQAQPYVAVFMDHSAADPQFMDLVMRNFGTTAATDVVLEVKPAAHRASGAQEGYGKVWLPDRIPTLVPGQEWRTVWDFTPARAEADLRDRHDAVVTFSDSRGDEYRYDYVLDWTATRNRMYVTTYGAHHGVKALREISKTLEKWRREQASGQKAFEDMPSEGPLTSRVSSEQHED